MHEAVHANEKTVSNFELTGEHMNNLKDEVTTINEYSESNAASASEITKASDHLYSLTDQLNDQVSKFKVK